jgi:hypothetical protein
MKLLSLLLLSISISTYAQNKSSMSEYSEDLDLVLHADSIIEEVNKGLETIEATSNLPQVVSEEQIEERLSDFSKAFYLDKPQSLNSNSIKPKYFNFKTITSEQECMAVGFKWLKVMTESGKNIIDTNNIPSDDDVSVYYVNHKNGMTDFMSLFCSDISINNAGDDEVLAYAEGEATVIYRPGYDKMEFPFDAEDVGKNFTYNKTNFKVDTLGKHYIKLIIDSEGFKRPQLVAYNREDVRLETRDWVSYPLYADNKTAKDFTAETYPDSDSAEKMVYVATFSGEVDRVELYFKKKRESRVLPIRTLNALPKNAEWDTYKNIKEWVSLPFVEAAPFKPMDSESVQNSTFIKFQRSEAMIGFNEEEVKVHLPDVANSAFATIEFKNLKCRTEAKDPYIPMRFTAYDDEARDFRYAYDTDMSNEKLILTPQKSRIAGDVIINYPSDIRWYSVGKGESEFTCSHRVIVEGGLVTYFPPEDYRIPNIEKAPSYFIRAISADGKLLHLNTSLFGINRNMDPKQGIRFGFWGDIETVEMAIVHEWTQVVNHFDVMVLPELSENEGLNDFAEFLTETGLITDKDGNKIDLDEYKDDTKKASLAALTYNISVAVSTSREKAISYTWNGVLLGENAFDDDQLSTLMQETLHLLQASKKAIYYKLRKQVPEIHIDVLDENSGVKESISLDQLLQKAEVHAELSAKVEAVREAQAAWTKPEAADLERPTRFTETKIPLATFIQDYTYDKSEDEIDRKQIDYVYDLYLDFYDNSDKERAEKMGAIVAYVLGYIETLDVQFDEEEGDLLKMYNLVSCLSFETSLNDIDKRIINVLTRPDLKYYLDSNFTMSFNSALSAKAREPLMNVYAYQFKKTLSEQELNDFIFGLPVMKDKEVNTSAHRYLSVQGFDQVYANVSKRYKETCYRYFTDSNLAVLRDNLEALLPAIVNDFASITQGYSISYLFQLKQYAPNNYDAEIVEIASAIKDPFYLIWASEMMMYYNADAYRDITYNLMKESLKNATKSINMVDRFIAFIKDNYGERADLLLAEIDAVNASLKQ